MRRLATAVLGATALLVGCTSAPAAPLPTAPPAPPPPTATPAPTATPVPAPQVDPIAAIVQRQTELKTFRQAVALAVVGAGIGGPLGASVTAEGEAARPNTRLDVRTDALGTPMGFQFVQADGRMYLNPYGLWVAFDGQAIPEGLPLVPIPIGADPQQVLPLLAGSQVTPAVGVPVRGVSTDVLRFTVPPERAGDLAALLVLPQSLAFLRGPTTFTELSGELAVARDDGFVRRVALQMRGYAGGDPARTFSIESTTELWDVNDPAIAVAAPDAPALQLPSLDQIPLPFR